MTSNSKRMDMEMSEQTSSRPYSSLNLSCAPTYPE